MTQVSLKQSKYAMQVVLESDKTQYKLLGSKIDKAPLRPKNPKIDIRGYHAPEPIFRFLFCNEHIPESELNPPSGLVDLDDFWRFYTTISFVSNHLTNKFGLQFNSYMSASKDNRYYYVTEQPNYNGIKMTPGMLHLSRIFKEMIEETKADWTSPVLYNQFEHYALQVKIDEAKEQIEAHTKEQLVLEQQLNSVNGGFPII